jgi:hypothetical protein
VFGTINDPEYYNQYVKSFASNPIVKFLNFEENKQLMYDSIDVVYHSSLSECASLVQEECLLTGTIFKGTENNTHDVINLSTEEIINLWCSVLNLNK